MQLARRKLYLIHGRDDFGCAEQALDFLRGEIGHPNRSHEALLDESFHSCPCLVEGRVHCIARFTSDGLCVKMQGLLDLFRAVKLQCILNVVV